MNGVSSTPVTLGMINMAHIRVAGVGGLGLVAMCAVVSLLVPPIGLAMALAVSCGTLFALTLILERRTSGPYGPARKRLLA
jgi:branched-subunit amino acid ABC-type transport system permease component